MIIRAAHSGILFRSPARLLALVLPIVLWFPCISSAQESINPETTLGIFEQRAYSDAAYEQKIQWKSVEDEVDYWTDQRNFEEALQKSHHQAYQVYLHSKRAAYIEHRDECTSVSRHGDYYQLQAAFYLEYGGAAYSSDLFIATSSAH
jgi:hypothetical protein